MNRTPAYAQDASYAANVSGASMRTSVSVTSGGFAARNSASGSFDSGSFKSKSTRKRVYLSEGSYVQKAALGQSISCSNTSSVHNFNSSSTGARSFYKSSSSSRSTSSSSRSTSSSSRTPRSPWGSGVPAYSSASTAPAFEPEPYEEQQPNIHVVPGTKTNTQTSALPAIVRRAACFLAAFFVVVALVGIAQVFLVSATVNSSLEAKELSSQISTARAEGNKLEVAQSSLSNPTRIKTEANAMGMAAPEETSVIELSKDVVATDDAGNLSLSKTLERASSASL